MQQKTRPGQSVELLSLPVRGAVSSVGTVLPSIPPYGLSFFQPLRLVLLHCLSLVIVGFDWARDKHDVCIQDSAGKILHACKVAHD